LKELKKDFHIIKVISLILLWKKRYPFQIIILIISFQYVYKYLNDTGAFIVSWTHPVYNCLEMNNDKVLFNKSYFDESVKLITNGPDKIYLVKKIL